MKFKYLFLTSILVTSGQSLFSQKRKISIVADVSGYTGKLPVSSGPDWQGEDTLVMKHVPDGNTMGAEYLIFSMTGDSLDPKNDSASKSKYKKIWRNKATRKGEIYSWGFDADQPRELTHESILGGTYVLFPGDSIHVGFIGTKPVFSGRGFEKIKLQYELDHLLVNDKEPARKQNGSRYFSPDEYMEYNRFYDGQIKKVLDFLDTHRSKLSQPEFDRLKAIGISKIEIRRQTVFWLGLLLDREARKKENGNNILAELWDSTMYSPWSKWLRSAIIQDLPGVGNYIYIHNFLTIEVHRKFNFQFENSDSLSNEVIQKKLIYEKMKAEYTGLFRERLICHFIEEQFVEEMGSYSWFAQSILKDYYNTPGFPTYKTWIKLWDKKHLYLPLGNEAKGHGGAPLFTLLDKNGERFTEKQIAGKLAVINFWYTGCKPCQQTATDIRNIQSTLKNDTNVVFLHVSVDVDKAKWKKSIQEGTFAPKTGIHLYTGGSGVNHVMVKDFFVDVFPTTRFIDHLGYITINRTQPTAHVLNKQDMADLIHKELARFKDGPYVLYDGNSTTAYSFSGQSIISRHNIKQIVCATDQNKNLTIDLQKNILIPPSEYAEPEKMFVLSDIEGYFSSLRKLLQGNKVIDSNYNWTFGKGHLVFAGDMFDRGDQVTECLWLIYSLEEKAKKAGGFVHFILGNHEIMNLNGQNNYVRRKYITNYSLIGKTLTEIYNEQSELGRWLRTKNIMEKIGNNLFAHGGISPEVNNMGLTLEQINTTARPYYDKSKIAQESTGTNLAALFNTYQSPFWYRHYYNSDHFSKSQNILIRRATEAQIDSTRAKFDVNHIITGHTIIADTISVRYNNKIINTDTPHYSGFGEALLIEKNKYFRVSSEGNKTLLFKDDDRKLLSGNLFIK